MQVQMQLEGPGVNLSGSLPGMIADFHSIHRDIKSVRDCAAAYLDKHSAIDDFTEVSDYDHLVTYALWTACAITYRRAFNNGKGHLVSQGPRKPLDEQWKDDLNPEQLAAHEKVWTIANEHIAHRAGWQESATILGVLEPAPGQGVRRTVTVMAFMAGVLPETAERLIEICDHLIALLSSEIDVRTKELLERLRQGDIEVLYAAAAAERVFNTDTELDG